MTARSGSTLLLGLVLAVALLHALTQARLRPLYQVSDEMAYLHAAQVLALADAAPAARRCIAPPDGQLFALGEGGKAGFRRLTAWQLEWLCPAGGELPLFALRALHALALPVVAMAAWVLAWQLTRDVPAALAAATIVAIHPVAAKYAGGVTPDAWANAFSAWAFVALTRIVVGRHRWWDLPVMAACTVGGLLWKDTTHLLVPLTVAATVQMAVWEWHRRATSRAAGETRVRGGTGETSGMRRLRGVGLLVAGLFVGVWLLWRMPWAALLTTPYLADLAPGATAATASPLTFTRAVIDDLLRQAPGFTASSILSLYRPLLYVADDWWRQAMTPWGAAAVLVVLSVLGFAGATRALVAPPPPLPRLPARVVAWWGIALVLCAAQPSVRLVLLDITGVHQGRWLFPLLAPGAALVGIGLSALWRRAAVVPLAVAAGLVSVWLVVIDLVRHYYVRLPDTLVRGALFTRPTGDVDVGDAAILALIIRTADAQSGAVTWGILVLLAAATLWLALAVARRDPPPARHA